MLREGKTSRYGFLAFPTVILPSSKRQGPRNNSFVAAVVAVDLREELRARALGPAGEAPDAAARRSHIEKDEAIDYGEFALVQDREEALLCVSDEIGDGHHARQDECDRAREEPDQEQKSADQLEKPGNPRKSQEPELVEARHVRKAEELRRPVLQEKQGRDNAQDGEEVGLQRGSETSEVHGASLSWFDLRCGGPDPSPETTSCLSTRPLPGRPTVMGRSSKKAIRYLVDLP